MSNITSELEFEVSKINETLKNKQLQVSNRKSKKEFITALESLGEEKDSSDFYMDEYELKDTDFEFVETLGGEGDGAELIVILKWNNQYWQISGYYSSWDSPDMDVSEAVEVYPAVEAANVYKTF